MKWTLGEGKSAQPVDEGGCTESTTHDYETTDDALSTPSSTESSIAIVGLMEWWQRDSWLKETENAMKRPQMIMSVIS